MANEKETKPNIFTRVKKFFREVFGELKKLTWPTRKELVSYTITVLAFIVIMSIAIGVLDFAFGKGFTLLGSIGGDAAEESALLSGAFLPVRF